MGDSRVDNQQRSVIRPTPGIEQIKADTDRPQFSANVTDTWGNGANLTNPNANKKEPPLPAASGPVKAPARYDAGPSIDEVAAGQTLELGHKGPAVLMLQQALNKLGADPKLAEDGMLGPKTFAALQAFQQKNGVAPGEHGSVGPGTLQAFAEKLTPEDIDRIRDRSVAAYAISQGQVGSVGRKPPREVNDGDIDRALGETEWTPQSQANVGNFKPMSQSDYNNQLGNGTRTIRQAGCMLTAYAMAATGLTGRTDLNPRTANDMVKRAGGFSGSSLIGPTAARTMGMREVQRTGVHQGNSAAMKNTIDQALASGRAVVLGVDYKEGSNGTSNGTGVDHWITITGRDAQGNYTAIDPVGGRTMTLRADGQGRLTGQGWAAGTRYVGKEAIVLDRA